MVNLLHYIDYYLSKTSQNFRYRNLFIQQLRYFLFIWFNLLHYIDYYLSKTSQNFRYRNLFIQQLRYFLFIWLIYCIILIIIYLKPLKTLGIVIYLYSNYGTFCLYG